jgi:hypothetical protein
MCFGFLFCNGFVHLCQKIKTKKPEFTTRMSNQWRCKNFETRSVLTIPPPVILLPLVTCLISILGYLILSQVLCFLSKRQMWHSRGKWTYSCVRLRSWQKPTHQTQIQILSFTRPHCKIWKELEFRAGWLIHRKIGCNVHWWKLSTQHLDIGMGGVHRHASLSLMTRTSL